MKCLLPLLWLRNERCKSGIKLEFLSPIFGSPEVMRKGDGMKSFQSRETQMTFLKNFPSTHRHLFRTNFRLEILQIAHREDSSIPPRKWDVGVNNPLPPLPHTPEIRRPGLHTTPLQAQAYTLPIHSSTQPGFFQNLQMMNNICRNLPMLDYELQKCHCANKSVGNHPAHQQGEMSG